MNCANHPKVLSQGRCHICQQFVCSDCLHEDCGSITCLSCYEPQTSASATSFVEPTDIAAKKALWTFVQGVVFCVLGLATLGVFFLVSLGLSIDAIIYARDAKQLCQRRHDPKSARLATTTIWMSALVIVLVCAAAVYRIANMGC
ncbi:MAG: hypothetical protein ACYC1M_16855 [Armatimonadota bacterium]